MSALASGIDAAAATSVRRGKRFDAFPYLLLAPAALMMLVVNLVPIVQGFRMSLLKLNQYTLNQFMDAPFIGLRNYRGVLFDPDNPVHSGMLVALRNTALYSLLVTVAAVAIGLGVALLLDREFPGKALARTLLMLPWVVPTYVVGTLWGFMWQRDEGIVNHVLVDVLHLMDHKPFWLIGSNTFFAIVIPTVWRAWPVLMLIFLAALQAVPQELYEAARLDGAKTWAQFRHITLPGIAPTMLMVSILTIAGYFQLFAEPYVMTQGGPLESTKSVLYLMFEDGFKWWNLGQASALAFVLFVIIVAVSRGLLWLTRRAGVEA